MRMTSPRCLYEHALYVKGKDEDILIVCLYVEVFIFSRSNPSLFEEFKRMMTEKFEITISDLWHIISVLKLRKMTKAYLFSKKATQKKYSRSLRCMIASP